MTPSLSDMTWEPAGNIAGEAPFIEFESESKTWQICNEYETTEDNETLESIGKKHSVSSEMMLAANLFKYDRSNRVTSEFDTMHKRSKVDIPISGFDDPAVHSVSNAAETIAKLAGKEKEQKRRRKKVRKRTRRAQRDSEEATEANEAAEAAETQIYSGTESSTRHQRKCVLLKLTGQSEMAYP